MNIFLKIYLWGCLAGFIACINSVKDRDNKVSWVEVVVSIICSVFSWLIAIALFVGQNAKHGHKDNDENKNDKNIFDDNNLAGT
jgi:hypothetical protein